VNGINLLIDPLIGKLKVSPKTGEIERLARGQVAGEIRGIVISVVVGPFETGEEVVAERTLCK